MTNQDPGGRPPLRPVGRAERKSVRLAAEPAVNVQPLLAGSTLPLLIQARSRGLDPVAWAAEHRRQVESSLAAHGGVLFRGFAVEDLVHFRRFVEAIGGEPVEYTNRSTPRTQVEDRIYTSTEYPADQEIPLHNENSYTSTWPMKVFFYCEKQAAEGGMTPIAYSARVFERISPRLRERFADKRVMYVRNFGEGADLPWQEVFLTADPRQVEEHCRRAGIELEWKGGGRLRTRQVCQAVARHPRSGTMLWFNQAHLFHVSSLESRLREAMLEVFAEEDLPRNAYYGDGSALEISALDEIRQAYAAEQVAFPWEEGDILLLDNMAVAHGRTTYRGERKIRVGMSEPVSAWEIGASADRPQP